ncbi:DNA (cytosine-5-)-methyltransferase [Mycoplasmopsis sturni]|uniref:DNA (cytosine-5-)-methyltransferase n=1 Tax=Mycoplasmopsis sturni TaxID=39047 RepID=UPI000567C91D|nr:DNA (cytosine-5-)-methyltransferase [Mycoplasmopsis sturni]
MPKIRILETFSGIGAQHKSAKYVNKKYRKQIFKVIGTCDWDAGAMMAYSAIHHKLGPESLENILKKANLNNQEEIDLFLKLNTISMDSKKPIKDITSKESVYKKYLAAAKYISNNYNDITQLDPKVLEQMQVDLLTYSFPCQGLSVANMGRDKGIFNEQSTSNLIWEVGRILSNSKHKPKYLLLENVKQLVNKYAPEYKLWKKFLSKLGYKTFTGVFNAYDHGSLQIRERVFAISVLKELKTPFKNDDQYISYVNNLAKHKILKGQKAKQKYYEIFDFKDLYPQESIWSLIKDTPSRRKIVKVCRNVFDENNNKIKEYKINTLTTKQDRIPNAGYIPYKHKKKDYLQYRFITPRETYKIMGFEDSDYQKLIPLINLGLLNKNQLWRQAGNSIDINVLKSIFETIYQIDEMNK